MILSKALFPQVDLVANLIALPAILIAALV
jgi:hypothetical protein